MTIKAKRFRTWPDGWDCFRRTEQRERNYHKALRWAADFLAKNPVRGTHMNTPYGLVDVSEVFAH